MPGSTVTCERTGKEGEGEHVSHGYMLEDQDDEN